MKQNLVWIGAIVVGAAGLLAGTSSARAAASDVRITNLNCTGAPETVVIRNLGASEVQLAGFRLQSDPTTSARQDVLLTDYGPSLIAGGASITYQSGPGATTNVLSNAEIYRNSTPIDWAQLVRPDGSTDRLDCGQTATLPTPTATTTVVATPSPSPTATPTTATPTTTSTPAATTTVVPTATPPRTPTPFPPTLTPTPVPPTATPVPPTATATPTRTIVAPQAPNTGAAASPGHGAAPFTVIGAALVAAGVLGTMGARMRRSR